MCGLTHTTGTVHPWADLLRGAHGRRLRSLLAEHPGLLIASSLPVMLAWLATFIGTFGYPLVGVLVMLESMGLPVPGETALLLAGAYAAFGGLDLRGVIAVAAGGAIIGDAIGYWLGRRYGLALLERYGRIIHLSPRRVARGQAMFVRHGAKTVFFGRFLPFLRMFAAFLAGVARMPPATFALYNGLGGVCWATTIGLLGYLFAANVAKLEAWLRWGVIVAAIFVAAFGLAWRRSRSTTSSGARSSSQPGAH